ncbi:MAG: Rieske (2Fe-2S) protein [Saprospiraceae bacterium]
MQRRQFIKSSCSFCLLSSAGFAIVELSSCANLPVYKTSIIESKVSIPVSLFVSSNLQIIRVKNLEYDIALRKENNDSYSALLMQCTHADNSLNSTGNGFNCNLHGSRFDQQGHVLKGPAAQSLKKYSTQIISDQIIISLK